MLTTILLLTSSLIAVPPDWNTSTVVDEALLDDFLDSGDSGDYALAIERIQNECDDIDGGSKTSGCTVKLACGKEYELKSTVDICSSMRIVGCGTGRGMAGSVFKVTQKTTAFRVWAQSETCPVTVDVDLTPIFTIEHVGITNSDLSNTSPIYGVDTKSQFHATDIEIRAFTHGLHMVCDVSSASTNCNGSSVVGGSFRMNQHAGIYVQGGDTNVMTFSNISASSNCRYASDWNTTLASPYCTANPSHESCAQGCANVIDNSFLGNSWVGLAASSALDIVPNPDVAYPGILSQGSSQRSTFVGAYLEGDQSTSHLAVSSNAIGGLHVFKTSGGMDIRGTTINRAKFVNDKLTSNVAELLFGQETNDNGTFMSLVNHEDNWPLRWTYDITNHRWYWDVGNAGTRPLEVRQQCSGGLCAELIVPEQIEAPVNTCWDHSTTDHACP